MRPHTYFLKYGKELGEFVMLHRKFKISRSLPWHKAIKNIKQRCQNPNDSKFKYYGGKGIELKLTSNDLRAAFENAKAWSMKQPSIDRINGNGHYSPDNIQWIEMSDNRKKRTPAPK